MTECNPKSCDSIVHYYVPGLWPCPVFEKEDPETALKLKKMYYKVATKYPEFSRKIKEKIEKFEKEQKIK